MNLFFGKRFPYCVQVTYFHRISLTPPPIEVPVPSQVSEWSGTCVSGVSFLPLFLRLFYWILFPKVLYVFLLHYIKR